MIQFILFVNKQGQTRLSSYYTWMTIPERVALEAEIIRKCLSRSELQCSFTEHRGYKVRTVGQVMPLRPRPVRPSVIVCVCGMGGWWGHVWVLVGACAEPPDWLMEI